MTTASNADKVGRAPTSSSSRTRAVRRYRLVSWLFGREAVSESVATRVRLDGTPEQVWNHIMFYEEVPARPTFLLRVLLPCPVRTDGHKTSVGATVHCVYEGGDLAKRITTVEPSRLLQFEIIAQRLGVESCILTGSGSYEIAACGTQSDVTLTTNYEAYLHPRSLWRPLETLLVSQLHVHILGGIRTAVRARKSTVGPAAAAASLAP